MSAPSRPRQAYEGILDLLAEARGQTRTLTEIARELGLAKSSVSNRCIALEDGSLIRRTTAGYRRTVEPSNSVAPSCPKFDQIREFDRACEDSDVLRGQLVQIAMLDGARVLYLAIHEGRERFPLSASVGDRYPASATAVGRALLSELSPEKWRSFTGIPGNWSASPNEPPPSPNCKSSWNARQLRTQLFMGEGSASGRRGRRCCPGPSAAR